MVHTSRSRCILVAAREKVSERRARELVSQAYQFRRLSRRDTLVGRGDNRKCAEGHPFVATLATAAAEAHPGKRFPNGAVLAWNWSLPRWRSKLGARNLTSRDLHEP